MRNFIFILFIIGISLPSYTQKKTPKITKGMLEQKSHPTEPDAKAAILFENVKTWYDFTRRPGVLLNNDYVSIIKIYDAEAVDLADYDIPTYRDKTSRERVRDLKVTSYNLVDGNIEKQKLSKKNIYSDKQSENWSSTIFAVPNVREGTIFEVRYTLESPFIYATPKWFFQNKIPTNYSEYSIDVPDYFSFSPIASGVIPLDQEIKELKINNPPVKRYIFSTSKVPSYREDKYVLNENDYRSSIKYELSKISYPGQMESTYSKDWNTIAKNLQERDFFGKQIKAKLKSLSPIVEEAKILEENEKIEFLYKYVRDNYKWNKKFGLGSHDGLKKVIEDKVGNTGELNLLFLNLLKKCDVLSYPVVTRGRSWGVLNTNYPTLTELNNTLICIPGDGKYNFYDASADYSPMGEMPLRSINIFGVMIKDKMAEIIEIPNTNLFAIQTVSKYKMDLKNNILFGTSQRKRNGYAATNFRIDQANYNENEDEQIDEEDEDQQEDDLESFDTENEYIVTQLDNLEDLDKYIALEYSEVLKSSTQMIDDKLFIDATLDFGLKENPFTEETREFPIFYNYKVKNRYIAAIDIPEGYEVESLPEPVQLALEEKRGRFIYEVKEMSNQLMINYTLQINNPVILPQHYPGFKRFLDLVLDITNEKIVLSKK